MCLAKNMYLTTLVVIPGRIMESIDTTLPLSGEIGASPGLPGILCCRIQTRIHFQTLLHELYTKTTYRLES